jgi:hypothetical protein
MNCEAIKHTALAVFPTPCSHLKKASKSDFPMIFCHLRGWITKTPVLAARNPEAVLSLTVQARKDNMRLRLSCHYDAYFLQAHQYLLEGFLSAVHLLPQHSVHIIQRVCDVSAISLRNLKRSSTWMQKSWVRRLSCCKRL